MTLISLSGIHFEGERRNYFSFLCAKTTTLIISQHQDMACLSQVSEENVSQRFFGWGRKGKKRKKTDDAMDGENRRGKNIKNVCFSSSSCVNLWYEQFYPAAVVVDDDDDSNNINENTKTEQESK